MIYNTFDLNQVLVLLIIEISILKHNLSLGLNKSTYIRKYLLVNFQETPIGFT